MVDNYLILSLKSTRELSNCQPLEFVQLGKQSTKAISTQGAHKCYSQMFLVSKTAMTPNSQLGKEKQRFKRKNKS